ncbi:MAG: hypothetical protein AAGN82_32510 [Myxococcota bacterium]
MTDRAAREAHIVDAVVLPPPSSSRVGDAPLAPADWYYNWSSASPLDRDDVWSWLAVRLHDARLPEGWIQPAVRDVDDDTASAPTPWDVDPEKAALGAAFERMILGARSRRTLENYRAPFLKLALWLSVRGLDVTPPAPNDVSLYLVFLNASRRNKSAAASAFGALQFVVWLNRWPSLAGDPGCKVPIDASLRAFSGPIKKAAPPEPWMIVAINRGLAAAPLAERLIGWAVLACFMIVGRFDDLCLLRWDVGFYESHSWGLRFFLEKRKTDQQYRGQWIDIADSSGVDGFSAVAALRAARDALGATGPVLRRTTARRKGRKFVLRPPFFPASHKGKKLVGQPMRMARSTFQNHYQRFLVEHCGISEADALAYTNHGIRAGAATTLVKHGVPEHIIMKHAGVTSPDWIATYDRVDLERRLECSRSLGL